MTDGCIRDYGYLPLGGRGRVNGLLRKCTECKILRAKPVEQKMAGLPEQRLEKIPPFQHSGMDVFGPFSVTTGRTTRANTGTRKIWVLLFTCLYSRGIHLETLWLMDASSFIMAFNMFEDIRGEYLYLKCDTGTNFVGARHIEERAVEELVEQVNAFR